MCIVLLVRLQVTSAKIIFERGTYIDFVSLLTCKSFQNFDSISWLNPLRAKWPMEPVLISGFCSVKRMRVFDSPWTGH